ncbi:MAG: hypothetical protein P4L10_13965 [Acidobacteriaceae bacterium]|nr:hypothetical protein [Acidobacteriaceae bacterium]
MAVNVLKRIGIGVRDDDTPLPPQFCKYLVCRSLGGGASAKYLKIRCLRVNIDPLNMVAGSGRREPDQGLFPVYQVTGESTPKRFLSVVFSIFAAF